MSTISFLFTIESFPFSKYLLQQSLLKTIYRVTSYCSTRQKKKNSHTLKFPDNTIQQADLSLRCRQKFTRKLASTTQASRSLQQKKGDFLLEIYKGVSII